MQACLTIGSEDPAALDAECDCFDRIYDRQIDESDLAAFIDCATGPDVPWTPELTPDCLP